MRVCATVCSSAHCATVVELPLGLQVPAAAATPAAQSHVPLHTPHGSSSLPDIGMPSQPAHSVLL